MTLKLTAKQWLGFFAMVVGMFMAILDIQIVASSLQQIQAGLSASKDEITWIQTSYLIAEVIMIPVSGWLAKALSTRVLYSICCAGFTVMSLGCAFAWDIESMIFFRAIQGLFGGAMIPTVFAVVYVIFPKSMQPKMTIFIGLVVTMAPTVGPILGGYLTDIYSWHFMFLINIVPGIFVTWAVYNLVDVDKPEPSLLKSIDFKGIFYIIISLGCLQYILEEGVREDWFESQKIFYLTIISVISFILLIEREISYSNPIINLSSFKDKNFAMGSIFSFVIGSGLYSAIYLLPVYLATIKGLNSFQIGTHIMITGIFQFLSAPIAGFLATKLDLRIMLFMGFTLFGFGCYLDSFLTSDSGFWDLFLSQAIRGGSLMFCFLPINTITFATLPIEQIKFASGLYNLMRNLGGAITLAMMNSFIINNQKINYAEMKHNFALSSQNFMNVWQQFGGKLDSLGMANSDTASLKLLSGIISRDAFTIVINDCFFLLALLFWTATIIMPFLSKPNMDSEPNNEAH